MLLLEQPSGEIRVSKKAILTLVFLGFPVHGRKRDMLKDVADLVHSPFYVGVERGRLELMEGVMGKLKYTGNFHSIVHSRAPVVR